MSLVSSSSSIYSLNIHSGETPGQGPATAPNDWRYQLRDLNEDNECLQTYESLCMWLPPPSAYVDCNLNPFADDESDIEVNSPTTYIEKNSTIDSNIGQERFSVLQIRSNTEGKTSFVNDGISMDPQGYLVTQNAPRQPSTYPRPIANSSFQIHCLKVGVGSSPLIHSHQNLRSMDLGSDVLTPLATTSASESLEPTTNLFGFIPPVTARSTAIVVGDGTQPYEFSFHNKMSAPTTITARMAGLHVTGKEEASVQNKNLGGLRQNMMGSIRGVRKSISSGTGRWSLGTGNSSGTVSDDSDDDGSHTNDRKGKGKVCMIRYASKQWIKGLKAGMTRRTKRS
jgi:hypothetical protein